MVAIEKIQKHMEEKRESLEALIDAQKEVLMVLAEDMVIDESYVDFAKHMKLGWMYSIEDGFATVIKSNAPEDLYVRALYGTRNGSYCDYEARDGELIKSSVSMHYFLNNPEGAVDELSNGMRRYMELQYKSFGDSSLFPKKNLEKIFIHPFVRVKETNGLDQILSVLEKVSKQKLMKIEMLGLVSNFKDFSKFYSTEKDISQNRIIPYKLNTSPEIVNKKIATLAVKLNQIYHFPYGHIYEFINFNKDNKNLEPEFIENFFVKELKNPDQSVLRMNNQALLKELLELIPNVKSKEFKKLQEIDKLGEDDIFIDKLPEGYDAFFLSRSFVKEVFKFNQKSIGEPSNFIQQQGLIFLFNYLAQKEVQPLSAITSANVSSVGDLFHIGVQVNSKYNRDNLKESLSNLVSIVKKITEKYPLSSYDLKDGFNMDRFDSVDRAKELAEYIQTLKSDKKILRVINKTMKNKSAEDFEITSNESRPTFKL